MDDEIMNGPNSMPYISSLRPNYRGSHSLEEARKNEARMQSTAAHLEELKEQITAKKAFVESLPSRDVDEILSKAKHQKVLGEKEEEYELILEARRRAAVVREHKRLHPPVTEECPICLETTEITSCESMVRFYCCGNECCIKCREAAFSTGVDQLRTCPLCRAELPSGNDANRETKIANLALQHAKAGRSWAQFAVGRKYEQGIGGFPADRATAVKWYELAAEQGDPDALVNLAEIRMEELGWLFDDPKVRSLLEESANRGSLRAQAHLAISLWASGLQDYEKCAYYSTLAYSQFPVPHIGFFLGSFFLRGLGGLSVSLYRAKHYLQEASEAHPPACGELAMTLTELCDAQYDGRFFMPGHSCMPRVHFLIQKMESSGDSAAIKPIAEYERDAKMRGCANCGTSEALKQCAKCRYVWYCGRKCQIDHWKAGHKTDCIQK